MDGLLLRLRKHRFSTANIDLDQIKDALGGRETKRYSKKVLDECICLRTGKKCFSKKRLKKYVRANRKARVLKKKNRDTLKVEYARIKKEIAELHEQGIDNGNEYEALRDQKLVILFLAAQVDFVLRGGSGKKWALDSDSDSDSDDEW